MEEEENVIKEEVWRMEKEEKTIGGRGRTRTEEERNEDGKRY